MFRAKRMATALTFAACLVWVAGLPSLAQSQTTATVFEGARLIPGDGGGPIENSALVMEGNRITAVGRRGEVTVWADGKTTPSLHAVDTTFRAGRVGIGSFFDLGSFRDVKIVGEK